MKLAGAVLATLRQPLHLPVRVLVIHTNELEKIDVTTI